MKRVVFKTSEAAAHQSGAMEADTISKNGRSLKSRMSRRDFLRKEYITLLAAGIFSVTSVFAQQGDMAIGGNLIYGTGGSYNHVGIGAKFLYNVTDPIRLAGEFDFFPKQDSWTWWDFSVYGHYLFPVADQFALYPSVGLGMIGCKLDMDLGRLGQYSESTSGFAFSFGGGGDYELTSNLTLNIDLRYKIINFSDIDISGNRINLAVGLAYKF